MRVAPVAVALAVAACTPHFRDDQDRALRAMDADAMQDLLDAATEAATDGDHAGAVSAYLHAIDVNPRFPASVYLALARELVDAGDPVRALAVMRFALARDAGASPGALEALAARFAAAELPALALEVLAERTGGVVDPAVVERIPELERSLGELLRAREHAAAGRREEALRAYRQWLSEYGVADHAVLRCWSAEALRGQSAATRALLESAQRAGAAGDFALAVRGFGLLQSYEPQAVPLQIPGLAEAWRRAGDSLRLGPQAVQRVAEATSAAEEGQLGRAIHAYRLAVLEAPWHPELRRNLATLLAAAGLHGEAARQGAWLLLFRPEDAPARESVAAWRTQAAGPASEHACGTAAGRDSADLTPTPPAPLTPAPPVARGQSGGPNAASALHAGCAGWIKDRPDHTVRLERPFAAMRMDVSAAGDTTLVVQTPSGLWLCNDDHGGPNPRIEGALAAGEYRIWIGSYGQGQSYAYELSFTENAPSTSPEPAPAVPAAPPPRAGVPMVMGTIALGQSVVGDTSGAPSTFSASCVSNNTAGDHVWRFTPGATGDYRVVVSAEYDCAVAVLDGTSEVACNDDHANSDGSSGSEVVVTLAGGRTYDVVVDGYGEGVGAYRLTIDPSVR